MRDQAFSSAAAPAVKGTNSHSEVSRYQSADRVGWELYLKRQVDFIVALAVLLISAPVLLLLTLMIQVSYGRPVFIIHNRVGRNGDLFPCLKFRTMVIDADSVLRAHLESNFEAREEWEATRKLRNDPRVTPIGRILRKTSLDELPQLINVLRGEMSLVGPRPIVVDEMPLYGQYLKEYLSVRPGMTGAWQVSGRSDTSYASRVRLDAEYARNWSLAGDFLLMIRTMWVVLNTKGSY